MAAAAEENISAHLGRLAIHGSSSFPPMIISTPTEEIVEIFSKITSGHIFCDCEGVDLSREGKICLVQVATLEGKVFLFDVLDKRRDDPLVCILRTILEDEQVTKIIHDCRMDSDALWHLLGIRLENVHDTSMWHSSIAGVEDQSLDSTLLYYNMKPNTNR